MNGTFRALIGFHVFWVFQNPWIREMCENFLLENVCATENQTTDHRTRICLLRLMWGATKVSFLSNLNPTAYLNERNPLIIFGYILLLCATTVNSNKKNWNTKLINHIYNWLNWFWWSVTMETYSCQARDYAEKWTICSFFSCQRKIKKILQYTTLEPCKTRSY